MPRPPGRYFTWEIEDLGPAFFGTTAGPTARVEVVSINDSGTIAGWRPVSSPGEPNGAHIFVIDRAGNMTDIQPTGVARAFPTRINASGWISGYTENGSDQRGFVIDPAGSMILLNAQGTSSTANWISDNGAVVGTIGGGNASQWGPGVPSASTPPVNLHDASFIASHAVAINDVGIVAGELLQTWSSRWNAATWNAGTWTRLPFSSDQLSISKGMNASGAVIGQIEGAPFVYQSGAASIIQASSSGFVPSSTMGISDYANVTGIAWPGGAFFYNASTGKLSSLQGFAPPSTAISLLYATISPSGGWMAGVGWKMGTGYRIFRMRSEKRHVSPVDFIDVPPATVLGILGGVIDDRGGGVTTPTGPIHVGPWPGGDPPPGGSTPGVGDVLFALALHEASRRIPDYDTRRKVQQPLLEHAMSAIQELVDASQQVSITRKVEVRRRPFKLISEDSPGAARSGRSPPKTTRGKKPRRRGE